MSSGAKRGRKSRPRTTAEKRLMVEVSRKFRIYQKKWGAEAAAKEIKVSRASFYNYLAKEDLPSFEVLKRAHDVWGLNFKHIDFGASAGRSTASPMEEPRQYVLPFIEGVREKDVQVIHAKPVKPDTLELTVQIRFAG